ncbi:MAG: DsrE family protein [Verrucomicrobia bacterium]|nr:DsrE family protein [Verrucomicrobiota bacterium]
MKTSMKNSLTAATVGGWRKLKLLAVCAAVLGLALAPAWADGNEGKTFLVHAKTSLKLDDAQICAVPNVAWAALAQGYQVTILFDASGVTALKKGGMFGGSKTPLDKARLPERERQSLAKQLNEPLENIPHDYGEYLRFLKARKGVNLVANRTMMLLYKIGEDQIEPAVTPIGLEEMARVFKSADVYVAY